MKTIVLIPVKNEEWILEHTLRNTAPFVDHIIIADQNSTDKTVDICNKFQNVKVVQNPYTGHSNKVRWLLLDEARKHGKHNLIICIDADEMMSPNAITEMKQLIADKKATKGDVFKFLWVQLWKGTSHYMNEGDWKDSYKNIAFIDNEGENEYKKDFVINDHTSRVPDTNIINEIPISLPFLHFHFVAWDRTQLKQAWYRCSELINGKRNAKRINNAYRVTLMNNVTQTFEVPASWVEGLIIPQHLDNTNNSWHLHEIIGFFDTHGVEFFEDLQIWHIDVLKKEFINRTGREPISKAYPKPLIFINDVKNKIRFFFYSRRILK